MTAFYDHIEDEYVTINNESIDALYMVQYNDRIGIILDQEVFDTRQGKSFDGNAVAIWKIKAKPYSKWWISPKYQNFRYFNF